jgi:hypothetical protein
MAEANLIYFVVSSIAYAKSKGESPEDFGTSAGAVATPSWEEARGKGPQTLVEGISWNKQQFRDFQMEILNESETAIEARIKGFGEDAVSKRPEPLVTKDDYIRFFEKKWEAIAGYLELEYRQRSEGGWIVFTVSAKR